MRLLVFHQNRKRAAVRYSGSVRQGLSVKREPSIRDVLNNPVSKLFNLPFGEARVFTNLVHCREPTMRKELVDALWKDL